MMNSKFVNIPNAEMAGGECDSAYAYYFRRCKEKKGLTNIESLPDELLFSILLQLQVEDIYNSAMLVSHRWCNMIRSHDFIQAHLQRSSPGLLVCDCDLGTSSFVAIRQGQIEVSKFSYWMRPHGLWNSCNGLTVNTYHVMEAPIRIINPAIKRKFEIPPCSSPDALVYWWRIAYSAASKEYKVVHTCRLTQDQELQCAILTIGVDKSWRHVCVEHLSPASKDLLGRDSIVIGGYIHCIQRHSRNHVLTLNVETETIIEHPNPQVFDERFQLYWLGGKYLSMFATCDGLSFEVWEMRSETGEWTKLYNIDLNAHKCKVEEFYGEKGIGSRLAPGGWLKYPEVMVFRVRRQGRTRFHIAYYVRTHEIEWFELDVYSLVFEFKPHTISLVGLG